MDDLHLKVYVDRSELVHTDGRLEIFLEGATSNEAKNRYLKIKTALEDGYLEQQIIRCQRSQALHMIKPLDDKDIRLLDRLITAITSEVGRALVALTIMQLCVKVIAPEQSIRLHKSSVGKANFSWREGISMRSLDKRFITPILRKYDLVRLNADGFMMTRSLAENYPYSGVYKAQMRGARTEWLQIIERIEDGLTEPETALHYLLSQLLNNAAAFVHLADAMLSLLSHVADEASPEEIYNLITQHIHESDYAARLMEIAMHSLMQVVSETGFLGDRELAPLSQMRSANKKHGNIGDIEIMRDQQILEAWDAKYGKNYLRDEIEELAEKLTSHHELYLAGFVTSHSPDRLEELASRIQDLYDVYGVTVRVFSFEQWVQYQLHAVEGNNPVISRDLHRAWLIAYGESIAQKRRHIAPIDEPCQGWVESFITIIKRLSP